MSRKEPKSYQLFWNPATHEISYATSSWHYLVMNAVFGKHWIYKGITTYGSSWLDEIFIEPILTLDKEEQEILKLYIGINEKRCSIWRIAKITNHDWNTVDRRIRKIFRKLHHPHRSRRIYSLYFGRTFYDTSFDEKTNCGKFIEKSLEQIVNKIERYNNKSFVLPQYQLKEIEGYLNGSEQGRREQYKIYNIWSNLHINDLQDAFDNPLFPDNKVCVTRIGLNLKDLIFAITNGCYYLEDLVKCENLSLNLKRYLLSFSESLYTMSIPEDLYEYLQENNIYRVKELSKYAVINPDLYYILGKMLNDANKICDDCEEDFLKYHEYILTDLNNKIQK